MLSQPLEFMSGRPFQGTVRTRPITDESLFLVLLYVPSYPRHVSPGYSYLCFLSIDLILPSISQVPV